MKQKLYAIVSKETGRIMKHGSKSRLAIFSSTGMAEQHAWRYGAKEDNYRIVEYQQVAWNEQVISGMGVNSK